MQDCGAPLKRPYISCNYVALSVNKNRIPSPMVRRNGGWNAD